MFVSFYTIWIQRLKIFWSSTPTKFSYGPPLHPIKWHRFFQGAERSTTFTRLSKLLYVYDHIIVVCRQQAEVILDKTKPDTGNIWGLTWRRSSIRMFRWLTSKKPEWKQVANSAFLAYFLTLKTESTCSSKTSTGFQRTARRYIPEDRAHQQLRLYEW
jgi:hypothetical protein